MENPHRDKCRRGALSILLAQVGLGQGVRGGGTRRGAAAADDVAEGLSAGHAALCGLRMIRYNMGEPAQQVTFACESIRRGAGVQ